MSVIAEVYELVEGKAKGIGRCSFEVAPQAGDELNAPDGRYKVQRASHSAVPTQGGPLRMEYALLVERVEAA